MKKIALTLDPRNARRRGEAAKAAIRKSLDTLGAGRSIVVDRQGVVIAGNGVLEEARALGVKVRVIDTDGSELVAVQRKDLATEDPKRRALALADNQVARLADWDEPTLAELREEIGADLDQVAGFGLEEASTPPPPDDPGEYDQVERYGAVLRLGEYRCDVSRIDYDRLVEEIRQKVGFDEQAVVTEMLRRLGA